VARNKSKQTSAQVFLRSLFTSATHLTTIGVVVGMVLGAYLHLDMKIKDRNGPIVGVENVHSGDEIMMLTHSGMIIRYSVDSVRIASRQSIGVHLMEVDEGDKVVAVAKLPVPELPTKSAKTPDPTQPDQPPTEPEDSK